MVMDRFDFSPLFRSTIGFDRLTRLVDAATRVDSAAVAYPLTTSRRPAKTPID
jgi:molecular chaperone IbpA